MATSALQGQHHDSQIFRFNLTAFHIMTDIKILTESAQEIA
jgi:hypothetical protein